VAAGRRLYKVEFIGHEKRGDLRQLPAEKPKKKGKEKLKLS